ncbi:2-polyprenyl-6-methoxyphenol hydroxylase-like FAD-dependent oxidoreductase [Haloactinospora alba]|uniref:2-polyprenyl-6-methoxyphenol hydroxylase-like FAD-dependent oxidoreductase n=1 Tax=Haloactinospora alba TaxID=405555 RepID=A0A543NMB8_9ACTN|nr:FAD-dependent oxidoreductase [Haloactinospora alba]TQN32975.1 2-polyprenyl-6-methoxyphenol hydroxylase-like FAD-dependent oxidoreductase [Haloactinospora alba]
MAPTETTTVAVSGGGPAGITLGLLLARAGVDVTVCEKHADFLRDFRGDTVHPSTLEILDELGLGAEMARLPQRRIDRLRVGTAEEPFVDVDLGDLPSPHPYLAMVPQWDFLGMLAEHARRYPTFRLRTETESTGLLRDNGAVRGLRCTGPEGRHHIRAVLTVAADGRDSPLRSAAGLVPTELGAPMDVLWLRLSRSADDPEGLAGGIGRGAMAAAIDRGDYWQIAYLIPKGGYAHMRARPVEHLHDGLREALPFLGDRVAEVGGWDEVAFLNVGLDRLSRWYRPGLLCLGDAAHTMTPVGGVGINLAVQDAVAAANLLAAPLRRAQEDPDRFTRTLNPELLARVQRRRQWPTVGTQALQRAVQRQVISRALSGAPDLPAFSPPVRALAGTRAWSRFIGRVLMLGLRPEHVETPQYGTAAEPPR